MKITLDIQKRDERSAATLRELNLIPGVVYGPKQQNITIAVDRITFDKLYKQAGESAVVTLTGLGSDIDVLVHGVEFHALQGGIAHVDFYAIEKGKEITTHVPLEFIGEAPIEKTGGILNKVMHEVEVTCQPAALPAKITVDISMVATIGDKIHISELTVPTGVTLTAAPDEVVIVAMAGAVDEDEVAAPAAETDVPQVPAA